MPGSEVIINKQINDDGLETTKTNRLEMIIPAALEGEGEPRPFLARGDAERRSFPGGLPAGSRRRGCLRGGVVDVLFTAFLGEWDLEELLPEVEAERERLLGHSSGRVSVVTDMSGPCSENVKEVVAEHRCFGCLPADR